MKPHNRIDDYIKDNLSHTEIPMSGVEELWSKIDPDKQRRKWPFLLWFLFGLGGMMVFGWSLFNSDTKESNLVETQHLEQSIIDKKKQELDASIISTNVIKGESENLTTNSKLRNPNSIINKPLNRNTLSQRLIKASNDTPISSLIQNSEPKNDKHSYSNVYSKPSDQRVIALSNSNNKVESLLAIGRLTSKRDYVLEYFRLVPPLQGLLIPKIEKQIKPVRPHKLWFGQVSLTSALVSNKISDQGMEPTPISEEWNRSVDPIASYQLALSIGIRVNSKSSINIGLEYQHIDNQFSRDTVIVGTEIRWNPQAFSTSNGFRGDSILVETITKGRLLKPIRETLINIPLRYNYNIIRKGHLGLDVGLGLIMNLRRSQSGPYLNTDNEWVESNGRLQNSLGFSYEVSVLATYALDNDQSLFLSPGLRYSPSDHLEELPFKLSRSYFGMELGYRVAF